MEFILDVAKARTAVTRIFDIAPPKTVDGGAVGVKVESTDEGEVKLTINGSGVVAYSTAVADVVSSGSAIISLVNLYKAVIGFSSYNEETGIGTKSLKIRKGTQSLTITAKTFYKSRTVNQRRVLQFLDTSVSDLQIVSEDKFVEVPINVVATGLRQVLFSASSGTETSGFAGVLVEAADHAIKFVSMNGVCLTEYVCGLGVKAPGTSCVLDSSFISKLSRVLSKFNKEDSEGTLTLLMTDRIFLFKCDGFMAGVSVMAADFPNYSSLLKMKRTNFVVDTEMLTDNLRNVMFNSDKNDDFRATLNFHDGELLVRTQSCENDGIPLEGEVGGSLHIDFNIYLLESCIRNVDTDLVSFGFKDRYSPVIIKPVNIGGGPNQLLSILAPLK